MEVGTKVGTKVERGMVIKSVSKSEIKSQSL